VFCTAPAIRHFPSAILCELIGSFVLMFGVLIIGANRMTEGLAPFAVAGLVVAIGLSLGGPTGYAINPARDLGPRIAHALLPIPGKGDSDWRYAPIPVFAPIVGMLLAAGFYHALYA
jgi:glycerol uptake facilitator protein